MDQGEFTGLFALRPQNYAWFLGAGSSRTAGLPTAVDVIWDLKRRYYCREENQEVSRQDVQTIAVRTRIQSFFDSRGFPAEWDEGEYTVYFERIFGADYERQRRYINAILSEENVTLAVGSRVLGALMASGNARAVFTTNFDTVIEKAVAEVSGNSLSAYHLEGPQNAVSALDNEEYPFYCKLHGDFRYASLKNLEVDLRRQNEALSKCLINAANRFGFVVAGYSGRDASVLSLFRDALESSNPFPHGLFWAEMKGVKLNPLVEELLEYARSKGVTAEPVEIQTFDAFLLRLWRNLSSKTPELDSKVRRRDLASASIPLISGGTGQLMRLNALPVLQLPAYCQKLTHVSPKEWGDLSRARDRSRGAVILTKSDAVYGWGNESTLHETLGDGLISITPFELPNDLSSSENLHFKGLIEDGICKALARNKPLLSRSQRNSAHLIVTTDAKDKQSIAPLLSAVNATSGIVHGLFTTPTDQHPGNEQVRWSESLTLKLEIKNGQAWLIIDPDVWIWPRRSRRDAATFLGNRRKGRRNKEYNAIIEAWIQVLFDTRRRDAVIDVSPLADGTATENPTFKIARRSAFSRRSRR